MMRSDELRLLKKFDHLKEAKLKFLHPHGSSPHHSQHFAQPAVYFCHIVDHTTRSKVSLNEHNGNIESIMLRTRKHNNMILRA